VSDLLNNAAVHSDEYDSKRVNRLSATLPALALPEVPRLLALNSFAVLVVIFMNATQTFTRFGLADFVWVLTYAITTIQLIINHKRLAASIGSSWFILLLPVVTLLSTLWSLDPGRSLYASIQLIYTTLIGIWIGSTYPPRTIFRALCVATGVGVLASLLNDYVQLIEPYTQADYVGAERYFVGIYAQKNVLGEAIDLLALSMIVIGLQTGRLVLMMGCAILLLFPLSAAKSVSSMIIFAVVLILPLVWWVASKERSRIVLALLGWIAALAIVFVSVAVDIELVDSVLDSLGKDSTLTGRTYLWATGWQVFLDHPLLGVGYQAFWQPGVFQESEAIRASLKETINGFHSAYVEVLVATGIIGVVVFVAVLTAALRRCIQWFCATTSSEALGSIFFLLSAIILTALDLVMFRPHESFYLLTAIFFVASHREVRIATQMRSASILEAENAAACRC
jgi:exopolysaccharide production protein ExoQ